MKQFKIIIMLFLCGFVIDAHGQSKAKKKADEFYKSMKYNAAIPLYEAYLQKKTSLATQTKLGYCYRMTNQMDKAEDIYAEVTQNPNAKIITKYYYAEALMANGKYDIARKWFLVYDELMPDKETGALMAEACERVKHIRPLYKGVRVDDLSVNTGADDFSPVYYKGGLVFASDCQTGKRGPKFEWTGRSYLSLYYTEKDPEGDTLIAPERFHKKINAKGKHSGPASFTAEGNVMYFNRNSDVLSSKDKLKMQIYSAEYKDGKWKNIELLPFCKANSNFMHPAISPDGNTLYMISDKPGGSGGTDIYRVKKTGKGWGRPENLGPGINSPANEGFPYIHQDGTLYFASKGHGGFGGFDLFKAEPEEDGFFGKVINMGQPINSPKDDTGLILSADKQSGYFASYRRGNHDDIYSFATFHIYVDGLVIDSLTNEPIQGATVELVAPDDKHNSSTPMTGEFGYELVANRDYVLKVTKEGYFPTEVTVTTKGIRRDKTISVTAPLSMIPPPPPPPPAPVPVMDIIEESKPELKPEPKPEIFVLMLQNIVLDKKSRGVVEGATVTLKNTTTGQTADMTTDVTGISYFELAPNAYYEIKVNKKGYFANNQVTMVTHGITKSDTMATTIYLEKIELNKAIKLDNIYYDLGKYNIRSDAGIELDKLVKTLKDNPTIEIELSSHTDSRGSDASNMRLSDKRAKAAVEYLISQGISASRLKGQGYGETKLVNECGNGVKCSKTKHQANRRTEFKVLKY